MLSRRRLLLSVRCPPCCVISLCSVFTYYCFSEEKVSHMLYYTRRTRLQTGYLVLNYPQKDSRPAIWLHCDVETQELSRFVIKGPSSGLKLKHKASCCQDHITEKPFSFCCLYSRAFGLHLCYPPTLSLTTERHLWALLRRLQELSDYTASKIRTIQKHLSLVFDITVWQEKRA